MGSQVSQAWVRMSGICPRASPGRARQRGNKPGPGCHSTLQLPREHFTTLPILRCLLDGASKAIPGLYFIVTFICQGCQSGPQVSCPATHDFVTHAGEYLLGPTLKDTSGHSEYTQKHTVMHMSQPWSPWFKFTTWSTPGHHAHHCYIHVNPMHTSGCTVSLMQLHTQQHT
jgi:hypothetical protein